MLQTAYSNNGILYSTTIPNTSNWLSAPDCFGSDSALVSFLSQLDEEGFCEYSNETVLLSWPSIFQLIDSDDYTSSIHLLKLPVQLGWRPVLVSRGSLTDSDFSIVISGWIDAAGCPLCGNSTIEGAIITIGQTKTLLSKSAWETICAVACFHRRTAEARSAENNRKQWSAIRQSAVRAGAGLSDFLKKTVVLTPERLNLGMRKSDFGESKTVEIIPTFDNSPERWIEMFDRLTIQERYEIPGGEGLVHLIISPEVKTVLSEIKRMPGRRVSGERAEAFIRNPFALLGPDAHKVLVPEEFEQAREEAGISFARFTARIQPRTLHDSEEPFDVLLLIEESLHGEILSEEWHFESPNDLERFIKKLEDRINRNAQCCFWEGFDLEILGDTPDQLVKLKTALTDWRNKNRHTHAEIFDLSLYSERVEGFGQEQPYYSAFIARKSDGSSWIPDNVMFGISFTPQGSTETVAIAMNDEILDTFRSKVELASSAGKTEFDFPGCPQPIPVNQALDILKIFDDVSQQVKKGEFGSNKPSDVKTEKIKIGLVIKANIEDIDYIEARKILSAEGVTPLLPSALKTRQKLKQHQLEGVAWLQHLWKHTPDRCRGALLADDMGLGKTLQLLAFIIRCFEDDPELKPALIVAPVSLLENWQEEIGKFFRPEAIPLLTLYGDSLADKRCSKHELDEQLQAQGVTKLLKVGWIGNAKLVLTTYETLRDLEFSLAAQKWSVMVCDESQKIKNPNAMVTRAAKKQNVQFKIACTGTPVENTLTDLWCLFDFIQPGLLESLSEFGKKYRRPIEAKTDQQKSMVDELREIIKPQIMRRTKSEVAKDLPSKIESLDCQSLPISDHQRKLYAHAISIFKKREDAVQPDLFTSTSQPTSFTNHLGLIQYLRRVCSDPRQIGHQWSENDSFEEIVKASPKMAWLMAALRDIQLKDEKVIVFCEFRDLQRTLRHCIANRFSIAPDIINGDTATSNTSANSRQKRLKVFQEKHGFGVIILSPLAVGFGVNIQAANHVIHFTRSWNPAKEDQATDRAYRIGQTKDVYVYYPVITADDFVTFDSKLDVLLKLKRELATDMLNGAGDIGASDFSDLQDIGGYSLFANTEIDDDALCSMQPDAFEAFCALLWSKMGYKSYKTPHSGDQGIDVVAINANKGVLIQCKTSSEKGKRLPYNAIYEVVGGKVSYAQKHPGVNFTLSVTTNQYFNPTAKNQAELHEVDLYDRNTITDLLQKYPVKQLELEQFMAVFGMIN